MFRRLEAEDARARRPRQELIARIPRPVKAVSLTGMVISGFLAATQFVQLGGQAEILHGRHYLNNHGSLTEVTLAQYQHQLDLQIRTFGGIAIAVLLASAALTIATRRAPHDNA